MKILIVDDHVLIRDALRAVLLELHQDSEIIEAAGCGLAMQLVEEHADLDLILLDLNLPDGDGFDSLVELRERYPALAVVVLSASHDRASVVRALELGAAGFIPKSAQRPVMLSALQLVFSGGIYIPPEILAREAETLKTISSTDAVPPVPSSLGLTERQLDVLTLMMQGKSNKAICRVLDLAEPTVKNHVTAIFKALKVTNRTEAVIAANQLRSQLPRLGS